MTLHKIRELVWDRFGVGAEEPHFAAFLKACETLQRELESAASPALALAQLCADFTRDLPKILGALEADIEAKMPSPATIELLPRFARFLGDCQQITVELLSKMESRMASERQSGEVNQLHADLAKFLEGYPTNGALLKRTNF